MKKFFALGLAVLTIGSSINVFAESTVDYKSFDKEAYVNYLEDNGITLEDFFNLTEEEMMELKAEFLGVDTTELLENRGQSYGRRGQDRGFEFGRGMMNFGDSRDFGGFRGNCCDYYDNY